MTQKTWVGASAVVLIAIVVIGGLQILNQTPKDIIATAPLNPSCNLNSDPCEAHFPGHGQVSFAISPHPIVGLKPLQLTVKTDRISAQIVEVDFRGLGMNMGFNRPRLEKRADGEYSGTGTLSVCVLERMTWEATVLITTRNGVLAAPFRFETTRHSDNE